MQGSTSLVASSSSDTNRINTVMYAVFLLLFLFDGSKSFNALPGCEEKIQHLEDWICTTNEDNTVNVTFDCDLSTTKSPNLWLWSDEFPPEMKALTIKNCDKVILANNLDWRDPLGNFSDLQILNVLNLTMMDDDSVDTTRNLVPRNTLFKDIELMTIKSPMLKGNGNASIDSLKFINLTIDHWSFIVLPENHSLFIPLKELIIENVTFSKECYAAFVLYDEELTVKIINSTFHPPCSNFFIIGHIEKLIITGNSFKEISDFAFHLQIDSEFVFSENKVKTLPNSHRNWIVDSPVVKIQGNTFDVVGDYGFYGIANKNGTIFNFSNNRIRDVTSKSLEFEIYLNLTNVVVFDNLIDCSCGNIQFFEDVYPRKKFFWFQDENPNKCLNIVNCTLNQVFDNFSELCDENYQCPVKSSNDKNNVEMIIVLSTVIPSCIIILSIMCIVCFKLSKNGVLMNFFHKGRRWIRLESDQLATFSYNSNEAEQM